MVKNSDTKLEYWIGFIPYFWIENDDINFCRRIYILPEYYNEEFIVRLEDLSKSRYKNLEISKSISRIIFEDKNISEDFINYSVQYLQLIGESAPNSKRVTEEIEDCRDSYIFDNPDNLYYYLRKGKDVYFEGCKLTDAPIRVNGVDISYYEFNEYQKSINYKYIIERMDNFLLNTPFVNKDIKNIYNVFHKKVINKYLDIELFILPTIDNIMSYIDITDKDPIIVQKYVEYYILSESEYTKNKIGLPGKYDINVLSIVYNSKQEYYISPRFRKELIMSLREKNYSLIFYIEEKKDNFNRLMYQVELLVIKKHNKQFTLITTGDNRLSEIFPELKIKNEIDLSKLELKYFTKERMIDIGRMFQYYFLYALIRYDLNIDDLDSIDIYQKYLKEDMYTVEEFKAFTEIFNKINKLFL